MIRLRVLGPLQLCDADGRELPSLLVQQKRLALLVYLAVAGGFQRRDRLLALFWPELDAEHGRNSLSQAIRFLKRELGHLSEREVVVTRGAEEVGVDPSAIWCDATAFTSELSAGHHGDALALYSGDFLDGFYIQADASFDEWLDRERRRLRAAASEAARGAAEAKEREGDRTAAVANTRRTVELSHPDERALRDLLELLDRFGDRAGALRAYDEFAQRLAKELDTVPAPETMALVKRIRSGSALSKRHADVTRTVSQSELPLDAPALDRAAPDASSNRRRQTALGVAAAIVMTGIVLWAKANATDSLDGRTIAYAAQGRSDGATRTPVREPSIRPSLRSVAVLNFENRSRDTSDAFLAEGLADEVATRLAQIGRLVVTSRSQVRRLRSGATMPLSQLGETFNVAHLVAGSVQRSGSRIRVNVEVLRANDARVVFADSYDRDRAELLDVQAEIASAIAGAIAGRLLGSERQALVARPTTSAEAYEHFLRGNLAFANRTSTTEALAAVRAFARAVALDSAFTRAWAGLARAEAWVHAYGSDRTVPHDSLARVALGRATRLAPADAATLFAAGEVTFMTGPRQRDQVLQARQHIRAALAKDSTDTELLLLAGDIEQFLGDVPAANAMVERAAMLDPRDPRPSAALALRHGLLRRFDLAARYADRLIAQAPDDPDAYFLRAMLAVMRNGDTTAMHADVERARKRLGAKTLNDAPNWLIYPLLRLDSSLMAALDDPINRTTPELLWMKMQRARTTGRSDVAVAYADSVVTMETSPADRRGPGASGLWLAEALAVLGRMTEAAAIAENVNKQRLAFFAHEWARILALMGRSEQSVNLLEQLLQTPSYTTRALLQLDPGFDSLRDHPRFGRLLEVKETRP